MQYTVTHDPHTDIVVATAEGRWTNDEEEAFLGEILETLSASKARRLLGDVRKLKDIDLSTLRLYERALSLQALRRELQIQTSRVAIVFDAADIPNLEYFRFFETAARNRGLPYRLFEDRQAALDWLSA